MTKQTKRRAVLRLFGGERGGRVQSCLGTIVGVLVILLITAVLIAGTPFSRSVVAEQLEKMTGQKVRVGKVHLGLLPPDLVIRDVETVAEPGGRRGAAFSFDEVRLGLLPLGLSSRKSGMLRRCRVDGFRLMLVHSPAGQWEPPVFAAFGRVREPADLVRLSGTFRRNLAVEIRNAEVYWVDKDGVEQAYAHGIDCTLTPVRLPGRRAGHYALHLNRLVRQGAGDAAAESMPAPDRHTIMNLDMEWISFGEEKQFLIAIADETGVLAIRPAGGAEGPE
ncbi:MAG: hypothetical protein JXR37_09905 [Kiritimatiellae bacterium]|nr:hypothetical protein [Kiritimatiellia bacterium]